MADRHFPPPIKNESLDMQPPAYDQVVEKYEIDVLRRPADWSLEGGDLVLTDDGDIKVGDDIYSAMFRLVERWRLESPTLEALFEAAIVSKARNDRSAQRLDELGSLAVTDWTAFAREFRSANEEGGTHELGRSIYAGTIFLVHAKLLSRFLKDLRMSHDSAEKIAPVREGLSFFAIVKAAANNFRHHDEWARTRRNGARQRHSIDLLATALRNYLATPEIETRGRNVCAEVLEVVSSSSYEGLNRNLFGFAKGAAEVARLAVNSGDAS